MGERKTYIINIDGMRADYFGAIGHQEATGALVNVTGGEDMIISEAEKVYDTL